MLQLRAFDLSISGVVWRFYLMMAVAVIFGSMSQWVLAASLAFIVAISFIVGLRVHIEKPQKLAVSETGNKLRAMGKEAKTQKAA